MGFERGPLWAGHPPTVTCDACRKAIRGGGRAAYLATTGGDGTRKEAQRWASSGTQARSQGDARP